MDPKKYIDQFGVIGVDDIINSENISRIMYTAYLNKFKIEMTADEYVLFQEYRERLFSLVEHLRDQSIEMIENIFSYVLKMNPYVVDLMILSWTLPRSTVLSKNTYKQQYKSNISAYNHKLIALSSSEPIKQFCCDTLTKKNAIPIHCIDFIWHYMFMLEVEFGFVNSINSNYFEIDILGSDSIKININMEYLLYLGLARTKNCHDKKMIDIFVYFMSDKQTYDKISSTQYGKIFMKQCETIRANPMLYLDVI